ncbi:class I SAM-dependent methyltransferase [Magnetococcus marinus]|nr:methyltransferase domain-containing protein [Magnetococcus marinus]
MSTSKPAPASHWIQYGCGLDAPAGWLNFDASPTLRLQRLALIGALFQYRTPFPPTVRYGDIVRGLPVADACAEGLYCSHVLEHLSADDVATALRHSYQILRPGGTFRLVLPDLAHMVRGYLQATDAMACQQFMRDSGVLINKRSHGLKSFLITWFGNSTHLSLWDYAGMAHMLEQAGFMEIRPARCGDSGLTQFNQVENPNRWENALGIACRRPTHR